MPWLAFKIEWLLPSFALVLFRISGLTLAAPIFSSRAIPAQIKVAFSFVVALMIFPVVMGRIPTDLSLSMVGIAVIGELLIGLILGLAVGLVFVGGEVAGMIIGQQSGIGLGRVVNPLLQNDSTILGQLYFIAMMMIFLLIGGHRAVVRALLDTFETVPPATFKFDATLLELLTTLLTSAFILAIRLAAPALIALLMVSLIMGFISRTIPQLNVLSVGFTVRVVIGLAVTAIAFSFGAELFTDMIAEFLGQTRDVLADLPSGATANAG